MHDATFQLPVRGRLCRFLALLAVTLLLGESTGLSEVHYVAPNGSDTDAGTLNDPFATIMRAQTEATAGDTVYLRGGTYLLDNSHLTATNSPWAIVNNMTKSGISYLAFPGERPAFDFSAVQPDGWRVTAFYVTADDCVFEGFDVVGVQVTIQAGEASNTQSECFRVHGGDRNRFERLAMHDGMGIGWYLTRGADNLVLNCDAYNNRGLDSLSMGNVDGFGAHPNSTRSTGNVIRGCRAWFNSDDGFDLINADAVVTIENCWSFYNGYFTDFTSTGGDGHGFKSGGYGVSANSYPIPVPRHVTQFCLAVRNRVSGFYANHHTGGLDWISNTGYRNNVNFNMLCNLNAQGFTNDVPGFDHLMKNNLGYLANSAEVINLGSTNDNDVSFNYFTLPVTVTTTDFESLHEPLLTQPRQANGDLPLVAFARLSSGCDLINAGLDVGFSFIGTAPDLGALEYGPIHLPYFDLITALSGGAYRLTFSGLNGQSYAVQAATDPALTPGAAWDSLGTGTFDASQEVYDDLEAANHPMRFYRIQVP